MKLLSQGAEAHIIRKGKNVVKERKPKAYRYPELDKALIRRRTRQEAKLLAKASEVINVPKIISVSADSITMQEIKGKKLASALDKLRSKLQICREIGKSVAKIHDKGMIHGDLTTSNMIYAGNEVYLVDFGLGFFSSNVEDKAVDLHVLKEALVAKHPLSAEKCFGSVLAGYKSSPSSSAVIKRLEAVEKRGRYKQQY